MASNVSILIQAKDQASQVLDKVSGSLERTGGAAAKSDAPLQKVHDNLGKFAAVGAAASAALFGIVHGLESTIDAANKSQSAMTGLNSVATAFKQDAGAAQTAAQKLASDGLMTVADAATGLKNLLASGFSLDQAVTLMDRFKNTAAFGRQSALSFGQAVSSATEGIKNGNSILVDNAGVTKNLSNMLVEAGFSAQDLSKATSDATIRQAIFNGILRESAPQMGDAAKLADSAAGKQAQWAAQTEILKQRIGESLQPALLALLQAVTPIITSLTDWISKNPELASGIIIGTTALVGLTAAVGVATTAIGILGGAFTAFKAVALGAIAMTQGAFAGLVALIASPIIMPAIIVGAALAALGAVLSKAQEVRNAIDAADAARAQDLQASKDLMAVAKRQHDAGKISDQEYRRLIGVAAKASGTIYAGGGTTLVGENGPELVNLPRGAEVVPAYRTRAQASQEGAGGVTNILSGNFTFQNAESVQEFFTTLDKTQRLARMGMA